MRRIPSLDGLRAISVAFVLMGHLTQSGYVPDVLKTYANTGVRMFFVISGFLITTILLNEHTRTSAIDLREFYIRRAYRILPAAGVFILFATVAYRHELRWVDIGAMVFYLVNYDEGRPWMVGHLWSLGVEEQFYFIWPGALKVFYRQRVAILWGAIALGPVFSAICYHFKVPDGGYAYFPSTAGNLAMGCLAAIYGSRIPKIKPGAAWLMLICVMVIPYYPANTPFRTLVELFLLWPILHACMAGLLLHVVRTPYRFLNILPVVWLGRISYSLYLWQQPFFSAPPGQPAYKLLVGVALACLSYYLVEQPVLRFRERRTTRFPATVPAGV